VAGVKYTEKHTWRHQIPPRMDTEEQSLVVLFGELADAPAVLLGRIRRPASFSPTAQMEVYPGSTGSYRNPRTTS
jgi:hypothetical protein